MGEAGRFEMQDPRLKTQDERQDTEDKRKKIWFSPVRVQVLDPSALLRAWLRTDFAVYKKTIKSGLTRAVVLVMVLITSGKTILIFIVFSGGR